MILLKSYPFSQTDDNTRRNTISAKQINTMGTEVWTRRGEHSNMKQRGWAHAGHLGAGHFARRHIRILGGAIKSQNEGKIQDLLELFD